MIPTIASGISKFDLKRQNRMQIIRLLRCEGPTSRIDISRKIHLTKAAVTILSNEMIEQGVLYEKGAQAPKSARIPRGRKKILLAIVPTYKMDVGLVIDHGYIYFGVCTLHGEPVEKHAVPIPPDASAETIFQNMEALYQDLLYKNDLKPGQITGLGICIEPAYYQTFGILPEKGGEPNFSAFSRRLKEFCDLPLVFGRFIDGAAIAACDYWTPDAEPSGNLLLVRCGEDLSLAAVVGREPYRGAHGRSGALSEQPNCSEKWLLDELRLLFSEAVTPELWIASSGSAAKLSTFLNTQPDDPIDEPVEQLLTAFLARRVEVLTQAILLFDPGRVVLLAARENDLLTNRLEDTLRAQFSGEGPSFITRSKILPTEFFLAGAALASRNFFLNRGGF